ncbi:TetR/AcrR family transcriptional regulator [Nocardia uniformis]|uniref:TetR/AcrR family transcriptional regulator n=1 Tax=Nocardia uniformis TaxID=53432 RepID=A0A849CDL3_9NOCA|nr:TetR/AcrR family transcriptional regulator [Nocardia uniformis]NNH71181.1 TetR/AcrR family transcriptional regulator [Nocardia uniformis]
MATSSTGHDRRPGRPQRPSADATRRALLDAGRTQFARNGFAGTGVQDILDSAGVTVPVLYHHFGNKLGLFIAVAEDVYSHFLADLQQAIAPATTFEQAMDAVLDAAQRIHRADPTMAAMTLTVQIEARRDAELAERLRPSLHAFREFTDTLAHRAPDAVIATIGRRHLARAIAAILNGLNSIADNADPDGFDLTVSGLRHLLRLDAAPEHR